MKSLLIVGILMVNLLGGILQDLEKNMGVVREGVVAVEVGYKTKGSFTKTSYRTFMKRLSYLVIMDLYTAAPQAFLVQYAPKSQFGEEMYFYMPALKAPTKFDPREQSDDTLTLLSKTINMHYATSYKLAKYGKDTLVLEAARVGIPHKRVELVLDEAKRVKAMKTFDDDGEIIIDAVYQYNKQGYTMQTTAPGDYEVVVRSYAKILPKALFEVENLTDIFDLAESELPLEYREQ